MSKARDIVEFFPPGLVPRVAQATVLRSLQYHWDKADVFVLMCPPASGKTELAVTVGRWQASLRRTVNYLMPDNMLTKQVEARYPKLVTALYRADMYDCTRPEHADIDPPCNCGHGARQRALAAARKAHLRVMNTHVYRANGMQAGTLIIDEAHKLPDLLADRPPLRLWRAHYKFPVDMQTLADVIAWGNAYLEAHPESSKFRRAMDQMVSTHNAAKVSYHHRTHDGRPDILLEIEEQLSSYADRKMWPSGVNKVVLMSATIGPKDIEDIGLAGRRVVYIQCDSPIPAAQRPLVYRRVCNMGHKYLVHALPMLARAIEELLASEPGKGLIHVPYGIAARMRPMLMHPRLMWHTRDNKAEVLAEFGAMPPESGAVLVASGLYEGIDLPFGDDSWQVIGKVPYPSLADDDIKRRLLEDPDWYDWQAIKKLLQAYGRLPRRPDGRGTTYIMDIAYEQLLKADKARTVCMFPKHYVDATSARIAHEKA